jgi:DNA end-binding protein Ku
MATATRKKKTKPRAKFRASWKGPIRFGLVSFQVQAINAAIKEKAEIHFHLLHAADHQRIRYAKVCPKHGEVPNDEIVEGFEYRKGRYIEVEKDELDALRTEKERALTIDAFVAPDEIDPLYFDGRMYYLLPAANDAQEGYSLLATAMQRRQRYGIGQVVFSGREQLALVRAIDGVLTMAMLNYDAEIRKPAEMKRELSQLKIDHRKLKLAEELIRNWEEKGFDFSDYEDRYREKVSHLLEAKRKGEELVAPEEEEGPQVINLIEALERSLDSAGGRGRPAAKSSRAAKSPKRSSRAGRRKRA